MFTHLGHNNQDNKAGDSSYQIAGNPAALSRLTVFVPKCIIQGLSRQRTVHREQGMQWVTNSYSITLNTEASAERLYQFLEGCYRDRESEGLFPWVSRLTGKTISKLPSFREFKALIRALCYNQGKIPALLKFENSDVGELQHCINGADPRIMKKTWFSKLQAINFDRVRDWDYPVFTKGELSELKQWLSSMSPALGAKVLEISFPKKKSRKLAPGGALFEFMEFAQLTAVFTASQYSQYQESNRAAFFCRGSAQESDKKVASTKVIEIRNRAAFFYRGSPQESDKRVAIAQDLEKCKRVIKSVTLTQMGNQLMIDFIKYDEMVSILKSEKYGYTQAQIMDMHVFGTTMLLRPEQALNIILPVVQAMESSSPMPGKSC